jgi:hypothetical protein
MPVFYEQCSDYSFSTCAASLHFPRFSPRNRQCVEHHLKYARAHREQALLHRDYFFSEWRSCQYRELTKRCGKWCFYILARFSQRCLISQFSDTQQPSVIYTVAEVAYHLIPNKEGVTTLVSLKGMKIGSFLSTSAAYFVDECSLVLVRSPLNIP